VIAALGAALEALTALLGQWARGLGGVGRLGMLAWRARGGDGTLLARLAPHLLAPQGQRAVFSVLRAFWPTLRLDRALVKAYPNTATLLVTRRADVIEVLRRVGGPDAVRRVLARKGFADIRFGPGERPMQSAIAGLEWQQSYALGKTFFEVRKTVPHSVRRDAFDRYVQDPVDGASPVAIAAALAQLQSGELLSDGGTSRFLAWLGDVKSGPNRLKGGLPEGWRIAHKTGTGQVLDIVPPGQPGYQAGYNDVGILTAPDGTIYTVAVLIGKTIAPVPERMEMMHGVVRAVAGYHEMMAGAGANRADEPVPVGTPEAATS